MQTGQDLCLAGLCRFAPMSPYLLFLILEDSSGSVSEGTHRFSWLDGSGDDNTEMPGKAGITGGRRDRHGSEQIRYYKRCCKEILGEMLIVATKVFVLVKDCEMIRA